MASSPRRYLDQVRITSPCRESWDSMEGSEQVRFCRRCEKKVYNLSAMSAAVAEALLARKRFGICVRYARRADGTLVTGDCSSGPKRASLTAALATASMLAVSAGCEPAETPEPIENTERGPAQEPLAQQPPERELTREERRALEMTSGGMGGGARPVLPICPKRRKGKLKPKNRAPENCRDVANGQNCDPNDPLCGL